MTAGGRRVVMVMVMAAVLAELSAAVRASSQLLDGCRLVSDIEGGDKIDCDFADFDTKIFLSSGDLHSNITYIHIANCQSLELAENAISHLPLVQGIRLRNIQRLYIASNNWTLTARQSPSSAILEIDHVSLLTLESRSFSGWGRQLAVTVRNVAKCLIMPDAFSPDSSFRRVKLQNIGDLLMYSNAFRGVVEEVVLFNVTMKTCRSGSFGGELGNITMQSVKVDTVQSRCLETQPGWFSGGSLTIQSSILGTIESFGINGSYWYRMVIEDSRVGRITPKGVHIYTYNFTVKCTWIGELESDALDVQFFRFAELRMSFIDFLGVDAFRSLRAANDSAFLNIQNLTLNKAESGSLAFSSRTLINPHDVALRQSCEQKGLTLQLVAGDVPLRNITDELWRTVQEIDGELHCVTGEDRTPLAQSPCRYCTVHVDDLTSCPRPEPPLDPVIVLVWVVELVVALVLVVGAAMLLSKMVRRGREKRGHSGGSTDTTSNHGDVLPEPGTAEVPDVDGPLQETTSGNARSDEPAFTAVASDPVQPVVLRSAVVDRYTNRPALPRPPSSVYVEMAPLRLSLSRRPVATTPAGVDARKEEHLSDNLHPREGKSVDIGASLHGNLNGNKRERRYENVSREEGEPWYENLHGRKGEPRYGNVHRKKEPRYENPRGKKGEPW